MAFATIVDLENATGREFAEDDATALAALDTATAIIQATTGQTLTEVEDETIVLDGSGTRVLLLPELPVSAVSSVSVDDEELDADEYQWSADGYLKRRAQPWPEDLRSIEITYTHGYATIPPLVVSLTAKLAARLLDGSVSVRQESIGSYSVTYLNQSLQADELVLLDQYRRR